MKLRVVYLEVRYGITVAIDSLSLEINDGVAGLFGPNGAGKSTLLRAVAGLLKPARGSIEIDGVDSRRLTEEMRGQVGYVGHEAGMYPKLTIRENFELFARLHGVAPTRVSPTLDSLDLGVWADKHVGNLSAGLKRRAAVGRALVHTPRLLLLDEPYANVDDDAAERITEAVKAWRAPGHTAIIATHGAKRVKPFADASVIMQRGRAVSHRVRLAEEASL